MKKDILEDLKVDRTALQVLIPQKIVSPDVRGPDHSQADRENPVVLKEK